MIGNGSSGIQVVPAMLPDVSHIDHYARGRTWLSPTFAREKLDEIGGSNKDNSEIILDYSNLNGGLTTKSRF